MVYRNVLYYFRELVGGLVFLYLRIPTEEWQSTVLFTEFFHCPKL